MKAPRVTGWQAAGSWALMLALGAVGVGCEGGSPDAEKDPAGLTKKQQLAVSPAASTFPSTYARLWMTNLANSVKRDGISPPVAARTYAYGAIGIYEAVVHGIPGGRSLAGQLNGLTSLPQPNPGLEYDWPTVVAATMAKLVPHIYVYPERVYIDFTSGSEASLLALGPVQIGHRKAAGVPQATIDNSVAYGTELGEALGIWANEDGYPEARYKGFIAPVGPDKWVPTGFSDHDKVALPIEPHYGDLRPLVLTASNECAPPPPIPFSTVPGSDFYNQADAVYQTDLTLTKEQRRIGEFWADPPTATATPAGHWLAIASSFNRSKNLAEAASNYALTGIGFQDAFIAVWQSKYEYNLLRPETYIRRHIDPTWKPSWPTPQFPEYVSGHSGLSGTSEITFTAAFGNVAFTDATKVRRGLEPRSFTSFAHAAQEAATSRLYGGIHYPMGNSEGLGVGHCVGNKVISRVDLTL